MGALVGLFAVRVALAQSSVQQPSALQGAAPPHVILVLGGPALGERVHGQTVELDARVRSRSGAPAGTWREQAIIAQRAARAEAAALAVWVASMRAAPGEVPVAEARSFVAILLSDTGRLYAREVGPPLDAATAADASAVLELAALSVRAALQSLDSAEPLGVPLRDLPAAEAPAATPPGTAARAPSSAAEPAGEALAVEPPAVAESSRSQSATALALPAAPQQRTPGVTDGTTPSETLPSKPSDVAIAPVRALVGLGLEAHIDGVTSLSWPSPQVRAGVQWSRVRMLALGEWGSRRRIAASRADLSLRRHSVLVQAEVALSTAAPSFVPWFTIAGGAVGHHRTTETRSETATATPAATLWSAVLRAGAALEYQLPTPALPQRLSLSAGLDLIARAPVIEVATAEGTTLHRYQINAWQPFANLSWLLVW